MKPRKIAGNFSLELIVICKDFAKASLPTSVDQYARRGQDPSKYYRQVIQLTNGKLGEELAYATYFPYYPDLSKPDYKIYGKKDKSWDPDLSDWLSGIRIAVKTKDARDAKEWGASWIFEKTDKKIFGNKLNNQDLDPNQYVCMVIVDQTNRKGEVSACINLQWLHDNNLFEKPDRDYLGTKLTVRLDSMMKIIKNPDELWQLKWMVK
jgi:hypothetical protein